MGVIPKQKISFLIHTSAGFGVGLLALSLFFLKEKNKGYHRNPLRELHVDGRNYFV